MAAAQTSVSPKSGRGNPEVRGATQGTAALIVNIDRHFQGPFVTELTLMLTQNVMGYYLIITFTTITICYTTWCNMIAVYSHY